MADVKISQLTALASASSDVAADVLAIVDTSVPQTKKITIENLVAPITLDKSNARVGIGESSPGSPLDVKSGEAANTANFNSTSGATNITFESSGSLIGQMEFVSSGISRLVTRTSASLGFGSNNTTALTLDSSQNSTFAGDVNVTADGARLFVKSSTNELVSIGRAGSSGDALNQGYIRMKNHSGTNTIALHSASNSHLTNGLSIGTSSINSNAVVHIRGGDSGQSSSSNNTQLTVENSGTAGIQLLTGTTSVGGIWVGDSNGSEAGGKLYYSNDDNAWSFFNAGV